MEKIKLKIDLIKARIDILKLKANDHDWACYVPEDVKDQLEKTLVEIDQKLKELEEK
jgi:hypothetical protein